MGAGAASLSLAGWLARGLAVLARGGDPPDPPPACGPRDSVAGALARALALPGTLAGGFSGMEVRGQPGAAALPPEPGFLVPAERAGRVEPVVGVGPDHARAQLLCHREDPASLLCPDPGGQAVGRVVGLGHGLVGGAEGEHGQDRPEDLLADDP